MCVRSLFVCVRVFDGRKARELMDGWMMFEGVMDG